jgi:hypothetical protein
MQLEHEILAKMPSPVSNLATVSEETLEANESDYDLLVEKEVGTVDEKQNDPLVDETGIELKSHASVIEDFNKLDINHSHALGKDCIRDSQATLQNELSFVEIADLPVEDLTPNAVEDVIPKFYHRLGKSIHTKASCDKILVFLTL